MKQALLVALTVALLAGCGDDSATETTTTAAETTTGRVYFVRDGKVWPVARPFDNGRPREEQALSFLVLGLGQQEKADLGLTNALPRGWNGTVSTDAGGVRLESDPGSEPTIRGLAQIVYTLSAIPGVSSVEIDGKRYTRADFEEQTPPVLVESPLPFEEVTSPLHVEGTANTFEATFNYELTDTDGKIVDENFVTATSGTGTRGTFDFTTKAFTVPFDGIGSLIVFERSAEDGSRIHIVEIPLRMSQ